MKGQTRPYLTCFQLFLIKEGLAHFGVELVGRKADLLIQPAGEGVALEDFEGEFGASDFPRNGFDLREQELGNAAPAKIWGDG